MYDQLSCSDLKQMLAAGAQLIDVRSHYEFSAGALPGAVNMPLDQIHYHAESICKDRAVLLYCRSGQRSAFAKQQLLVLGHTAIYNIGSYTEYASCQSLPVHA